MAIANGTLRAVKEQQSPFHISTEIPNTETIAAIENVRKMKENPAMEKSYTDVDQRMEELLL